MWKLIIGTMLYSQVCFYSCSISRVKPCCRFSPGLGGFERTKMVKLNQKIPKEIAIYKTEAYTILLDKKASYAVLKDQLEQEDNFIKSMGNPADTMDLKTCKLKMNWYLTRSVVALMNKRKAVIIDNESGQKLIQVERRKYNYQKAPRIGRGGVEYSDKNKKRVIIGLTYWVS